MNIFKSKKFIVIVVTLLVIFISLGIFLWLRNRETKSLVESTYTAYLVNENEKILEIEFSEEFYECKKGDKISVCSDVTSKVNNLEISKELDIDLAGLTLEETITNYINALVQKEDVNEILIISNYDFREILDNIKENVTVDIYFDYQEDMSEVDLEVTYYTITFDTMGGSSIDSIVVKENDKISLPEEPTRDGYEFQGWYIGDDEYNFEDLVKSDLTLTAKWKRVSTSSGSSNSGGTSSNNSSSSKINLNSNVSATVYLKSTGMPECFFYMFVNNLGDVYPEITYTDYSNNIKKYDMWLGPDEDARENELTNTKLENSSLTFNTNKESNLKKAFEKYKNGTGIIVNSYSIDNHKISFEYEYITFNGLNVNDGTSANKEIQSILNGSSLFQGPCGGFDMTENVTVDEEICEKFNLDCGRW